MSVSICEHISVCEWGCRGVWRGAFPYEMGTASLTHDLLETDLIIVKRFDTNIFSYIIVFEELFPNIVFTQNHYQTLN